MQFNLAQSLLIFFSLFSFANAALLFIYSIKARESFVVYWIVASLMICLGAIFGANVPHLPGIPSYQTSVICSFLAFCFFNCSIASLLGRHIRLRYLGICAVGGSILFLSCLYVISLYAGSRYQPAGAAIFMGAASFVGFLLSMKYFRKNAFNLAGALSFTFLLITVVWVVRFFTVVNLQAGFAYEGGVINAAVFIVLMVLEILRFLIFIALVNEIAENKRGLILEELNQLKLDLADQKIAKSEQQLRYVLNITGDGIWDWNLVTGEVQHNERWHQIVGERVGERIFTNHDFKIKIHPDDLAMVLNRLETALINNVPFYIQYRIVRTDSQVIWVQDRGQVVERSVSGEPLRMIGAISDISNRKKDQDQIKELAFFDQLTKLPNRNYIKDRIFRAIQESVRTKTYSGLIYLDLDNFKNVNDHHGHHMGDILLREFGKRIQHAIRPKDIVARIGGDEFLILLEQLDTSKSSVRKMLEQIIARIEDNLLEPFHLADGVDFSIKASSGVVIFGEEVAQFDDILKFADLAMYSAKRDEGVSHRFFDDQMQADFNESIQLLEDLSKASEQGQIYAEYQPIVDRQKKCIAYEALARWEHPARGIVLPDDFIPYVKEIGLINQVGYSILNNIFKNRELWGEKEIPYDFSVMVNISAHQLTSVGFADQIIAMCLKFKVPLQRLTMELTEGVLLSNVNMARDVMIQLQKLGVQFSLDDFGTGYSSLKYLLDLPFQYLKIDKKFIDDLGKLPANAVIVDAILELAKGLDLKVIAEGVETQEQFDILYEKGCSYFQGYFFGKPSKALADIAVNHQGAIKGGLSNAS